MINGYVGLLANLSTEDKLDLIAQLTTSVKADLGKKRSMFKAAFGALESDKSAEEIINEIRTSRVFNRTIESF
ncbi:hypothetical protein GCM10028773_19330 [Spirosoma koreense]